MEKKRKEHNTIHTRTETTQTVLIVVVAIFLCALLLWGLDSLFGWAMAGLLG